MWFHLFFSVMSSNSSTRDSVLRFGRGDLLWAMIVLALALGWLRTSWRASVAEHDARALQGAFRPGELRYEGSGKVVEMPRWSPASDERMP